MSSFLVGQTVYSINQPSNRGIINSIGPDHIEIIDPQQKIIIIKQKNLYTNDPQIIIDNLIQDKNNLNDTFFTNKQYIQQLKEQKIKFEGLNRNFQHQIYKLNSEIILLNEIITLILQNTSLQNSIQTQIDQIYKNISLL
tara:strand:- start:394 stop:813 length:420 start_codon:yes stop_codon:yes gene_type:complete